MTTTLNPLRNARNIGTGGTGGDIERRIEELEEDVERALQGSHVYSTTEKVVGEWIDGKPIYEIVTSYEGAWNRLIERVLVENVDTIIGCSIRLTNLNEGSSSYLVQRVSGCLSSLDECFQVVVKDGDIKAYSLDTWVRLKVDFILNYTK